MTTAWRVCKRRWAGGAFSGEGAAKYPGRWNRPGNRMVYLAESRSLASLEVLAHTDDRSLLNHMDFVVIPVVLEDGHVLDLAPGKLPANWASLPTADSTQLMGEKWLTDGTSVGLRVPSIVTRGEFNILLNPRHPDFQSLKIGTPEPYVFDHRIAR